MKRSFKRLLSAILVLIMVVGLVSSVVPAADTATFSYNTGKRDQTCTSLSEQAKDYYTGSYTYSKLSKKSASSLKSSLSTLMTDTHTYMTTYTNLKTYTKYSDANAGSTKKIVDFYTSSTYSGTWDNGSTWNREHVWCQSLGTFTTKNCGADLHHLRPTNPKVNSTRNNLPYGEVCGTYKTATTSAGIVGGYYTSKCFEPKDNVKGDIARILLYCYVRWGETNLTDVIQSVDLLLEWCRQDPVDTWEMGRNDVVEEIQGNRNVFIDYPEYAWLIFGKSVPKMTTPSGKANSGKSTGTTFKRVTSAENLTSGNYILVVKVGTGKNPGSATYYAMQGKTINTSYVAAVSADSFMNGSVPSTITVKDATIVWKLKGTASSFTLVNDSKKLIGSGNSLYCKTGTATKWSATYSGGRWTIKNGSKYLALRPDLILGSNGYPRFRCNGSASSTNYRFYLYKQS